MLFSALVPGILCSGGMAVLPVGETTSAPESATLRDAVLAEAATPAPDDVVTLVAIGL
jgi:hypothetical protein